MKQFDHLVLGSGIAGLSFALKVAARGRVAIITKKNRAESNTNYAQGGIAAVTSKEDSFEMHIRDTLEAGAGLCHEKVVRTIVEEGPARIAELIELGMKFSERDAPSEDGGRQLDLGKEGGHSKRRILHAKDVTGREIESALLAAVARQPNIEIFENHLAIDLITTQKLGASGANRCLGVYVLDKRSGRVETFVAPVTLLATGGCGKVYLYTTNSQLGDSVIFGPQVTDLSERSWRIGSFAILSVAAFLRLYNLNLVPLHHDEGVNGNFLVRLVRDGFYQYDPANYHGPTLYYFAALISWALKLMFGTAARETYGLNTVTIRLVPALFGLATIGLVLLLRRRIGTIGTLAAALLLAISPGAVYLSRYFIHETLFVFFTLGAVVAGLKFYEERRPAFLHGPSRRVRLASIRRPRKAPRR